MLDFKPRKEKHGWRKKDPVYSFKKSRNWLREKFEGTRIGIRKLKRVSEDWDNVCYQPFVDYEHIDHFLYTMIGRTYQYAWEKFLKKVKHYGRICRKTVRDFERLFKDRVGVQSLYSWNRNKSVFYINNSGVIDFRRADFNYKPKKIYKKEIREHNGENEISVFKNSSITPIDKQLYVVFPGVDIISKTPIKVFTIGKDLWSTRVGKYSILLDKFTIVVVPGWKIKEGYFIVRKINSPN